MAQTRKQRSDKESAPARAPAREGGQSAESVEQVHGNAFAQEQLEGSSPSGAERGPAAERVAERAELEGPEHSEDLELSASDKDAVEADAAPGTGAEGAIAEEEAAEAKSEGEAKLSESAPELGGGEGAGDEGGSADAPAGPAAPPEGAPAPAAPAGPPSAAAAPPAPPSGGAPGSGATRADVGAAVGRLSAAQAAAGALTARAVTFRPGAGEVGKDPAMAEMAAGRRSIAEGVASGFVQRSAGTVDRLMSTAQDMPKRIMATTESAMAGIDAAIVRGHSQVDTAIATARAAADTDAASAHAHIDSQYASATTSIESAVVEAVATVQGAHVEAEARLVAASATQTGRVESVYSSWDRRFWAIGPAIGQEATALGAKKAAGWRGQKNGESSFWSGPVHDNRMEARAEASEKVADEYRKSLVGSGNEQAQTIQAGKPRDLEGITQMTEQSRSVLTQQLDGAMAGLNQSRVDAVGQAGQAQAQLHAAVDQKHQATLMDLEHQDAARHGQLDGYGGQQRDAVLASGAEAAATVARSAGEAGEAMAGALGEADAHLSAAQAPDPDALEGALTQAELELDDIAEDAGGQLEAASAQSEAGVVTSQGQIGSAVDQLGSESVGGIDAGAQATTSSIEDLKARTTDTFGQIVQTHRDGVAQSTQASKDGFKEVGNGIDARFDQMGLALDQNFDQGAQGLQGGLRGALKDEEKDINKHAEEAASAVKPRWKKALKVLLIVAVIVVVCVLAGPLAAGLGAIGLSGMGAAVAAGAILGAAAGATIQMGNNLVDGRDLMEGVGKAAIMGAIGGAFGGLGAGLASGLSSTVGRIGLEFGIDMLGGLLGELAVGNSPTLGGILLGAGIGAGVGVGMKGFSAAKIRLSPDVTVNPKVDVGGPKIDAGGPKVDAGGPKIEAGGPKADGTFPEAGPVPRAEAPAPTAKRVQGEAPAPKKASDSQGGSSRKARRRSKNSPEAKAQQAAAARSRIEAKYGSDGAETFDILLKRTRNAQQAEATLKNADELGMGPEVNAMIRSGKLDPDSLQGLNKNLKAARHEVRTAVDSGRIVEVDDAMRASGTRSEILEAASRTAKGNDVSIGGRSVDGPGAPSGKADLVDYTAREAVQMKTVTGRTPTAVVDNLNSATKQLGGDVSTGGLADAEVPPQGFQRVADIRVAKSNELHGASRAEVLGTLRGRVTDLDNLDKVITKHGQTTAPGKPGEVRIDTGHSDGPFRFTADELRGGGGLRDVVESSAKSKPHFEEMPAASGGATNKQSLTPKTGGTGTLTAAQKALSPGAEIPLPPKSLMQRLGLSKPVGKVIKVNGDDVLVEVGSKVEVHSRPRLLRQLDVHSQQTTKQPALADKHGADGTEYREFSGAAFNKDLPSPEGIHQGALGDCWFMASMGAAARAKPKAVRSLVQSNGNGTYDVTLHLPDGKGGFIASTKTVDMALPSQTGADARYAKNASYDGWWAALLEKRLAMEAGSYEFIRGSKLSQSGKFSGMRGGTELLTGVPTRTVRPASRASKEILEDLQLSLDEGRAVTVGTHNSKTLDADFVAKWEGEGVYFNHAYSVRTVDVAGGKIVLDNPHGPKAKDIVMDVEDFKQVYSSYTMESH